MQQLPPSDHNSPRDLRHRLDRMFGEINGFLLVVAIGLAVFDLIGFVALRSSADMTRIQRGTGSTGPALASAWERSTQLSPAHPTADLVSR